MIPAEAIDSFAGVGYYFDLAKLRPGETVVDLGSGSGMDSFVAALKVGSAGRVIGIDMTDEQLAKAERLRKAGGVAHVAYRKGYIQRTGLADGSFDWSSATASSISRRTSAVFREAARLLGAQGASRSPTSSPTLQLPDGITCDATLWAACIGGAMRAGRLPRRAIRAAGLRVEHVRENREYRFISKNAQAAAAKFGVKSISLVATKD